MKELFWEYINPTNEEKEKLWQEAVFVFDTNILLNLYRYSNKTRNALLSAFESLDSRIWMPYHVGLEFMRNRCEVILKTVKNYNDVNIACSSFLDSCKNKLLLKEDDIIDIKSKIEEWIFNRKETNLIVTDPNNDPILDKILEVFNKKIGEPYSEELLAEIKTKGRERYEKKIPPGYKDKTKCKNDPQIKKEENDNNMYGDYIIWEELMKYSKKAQKDIIFVTNDVKEDWWNIVDGKTLGPRCELRKEFAGETKKNLYMYSMNHFIDLFSADYIFDHNVIDEIELVDKVISKDTEKRCSDCLVSTDYIDFNVASMMNMVNQNKRSFPMSELRKIEDRCEDIIVLKENLDKDKNRIEFIRNSIDSINDVKDKEEKLHELSTLSFEMAYLESIRREKVSELLNLITSSID